MMEVFLSENFLCFSTDFSTYQNFFHLKFLFGKEYAVIFPAYNASKEWLWLCLCSITSNTQYFV